MTVEHGDRLLVNGRIWTGDEHVEAVAIRNGKILAAGSDEAVREIAERGADVLDLDGRRAIPGLIDSHVHFLRGGQTWNDIVRWDGVPSLEEGLRRIAVAASSTPAGTWLRVLGSWHPGQFSEGRGPTQAELDRAAPDHPVYVQLLYEWAILNSMAANLALGESNPPGGEIERDATGAPTGLIRGPGAFGMVLGQIPAPTRAAQVASTKALMADFNATGITGVIDPGGFGVIPESYGALFDTWRAGEMTLRVGLYVVPGGRGTEVEDLRQWVRYVQPGFGDDMLRYVGAGEILTFGCHDLEGVRPFEVSKEAKADLTEITRMLSLAGWPIHMHAVLDPTIGAVLDVFEEVAADVGLRGRVSLAHAEPIGRRNLERVKALGIGIAIQDRMIMRSADSAAFWGEEIAIDSPPLRDILDLGIPLGAGTDGTVVASHDPWQCIHWLVTGKSIDGAPPRSERHRLTIEEALAAYTSGSAWFSLDEHKRGTLKPGMLADIAVLSDDVFAIDPDSLTSVRSDLTMVGGVAVHAAGPFSGPVV
ncbi:MAG: amidohydrolase [Acidimicrobiia bacterium]|nr:amidohydrolase [Acidimicrobiia bacterium]